MGKREGKISVMKGVAVAVFLLASIPFPLRAAEKEAPRRRPKWKPRSRRPPNRTTGSDPGTN